MNYMENEVIICEVCGATINGYHNAVRCGEEQIICKACAYDVMAPEFDKLLDLLRCCIATKGNDEYAAEAKRIFQSLDYATKEVIYADDTEADA